jgi:FAD/FMN-containing dehydrogenase
MNRDAANIEALRKVKAIVDPAGILNPGKLCF